jgi:hypothetical protein
MLRPVYDSAIGEERREACSNPAVERFGPPHIEVSLLLAGEGTLGGSSAVALERTATSVATSP